MKDISLIALIVLMCSCAGPMDPFGSINVITSKEVQKEQERSPASFSELQLNNSEVKINFYPKRKLWHKSQDLIISIIDPSGIKDTHNLEIYFGKKQITDRVLKQAKIHLSRNKQNLVLRIPTFRLMPEHDEDIIVVYKKDPMSIPYGKVYQEPSCPIDITQNIVDLEEFKNSRGLLKDIEKIALQENINPSFVAGLVAQESSFNPKAVSYAKAIGLTQMTSLAEQEIIRGKENWPRYPRISNLSVSQIKSLIYLGRINEKNEWRLDEEKSIKGGIDYIRYLEDYWNNEEVYLNYLGLNNHHKKSEIILASYNSGAYRVKRAIDQHGKNWMNASNLKEGKKYVNKVKSYCYEFARRF